MSRLHLVFLCLFVQTWGFSQNELGKYLEFADQQYQKGDYVYALDYYQKAMELDSNSVSILWKYAETLKAYKDYPKASYYYEKVYNKEEAGIYPPSLLNWALMEKQQGHYDIAIELFKRAKKKYVKNKKDYLYLKAKRELESTLWAQTAIKDTLKLNDLTLPEGLNTVNSEFGHSLTDSLFYFSSLRADSIGLNQEIYDPSYTNQLYTLKWEDDQIAERLKAVSADKMNTGNGCFSLDKKRFYFSQCTTQEQGFQCQIAVVRIENGRWGTPSLLGDIINEPGANTSTPAIAEIDGEEWLIFSSNRKDGDGGMDLYFAVMKNSGNQFGKVKPFSSLNSIDNEITPWFDSKNNRLYFASQWWDGLGGYDIHYSTLENGKFSAPKNAGIPFNSPANDTYFFAAGDSSFVTSNRLGVLYAKNPTCCSDIFAYSKPIIVVPVTKKETLADLNKRLPVTLYFHNDIPDPRSRETTTKVNYMDSYTNYVAMIPEYKTEYAKGLKADKAVEAEEDIESFFLEYVDKGVSDLELFKTLLLEELNKGFKLRVSVRGFASPLAKTEYNVALTKRRIQSLINHLSVSNNGAFKPYLDGTAINGGKLEVVGMPFGEYTANQITSDNPNDLKNSVFSRAAAIERKIEIQSVNYLDADSLFFLVDLEPTSIILGKQLFSSTVESSLQVYNNGVQVLKLIKILAVDSSFIGTTPIVINPKEKVTVTLKNNQALPRGIFSTPLQLYFEGYEKPIQIMVLGEGI
ncbi:MAG: tetratricopeptide repeat protein [Fluviicola sp.]|nr:tetratricopeptide repeat protein [Fluviicola sp.]